MPLHSRFERSHTRGFVWFALSCALAGCGADEPNAARDDRIPLGVDAGNVQAANDAERPLASDPSAADVVIAPAPPADWDAAVPESALGKTFGETSYTFVAPASLATAFNTLASGTGSTRVFVNDVRSRNGTTEVRYGAASPGPDGGLIWQEAAPSRTFRIAPSVDDPRTLVSEPFTYTLRASITSSLSSTGRYLLGIEAVQTTWSATLTDDLGALSHGTLYGVITRAEAELRPLSLGPLCSVVCGLGASVCSGAGVSTLAGMFDCTHTERDADVDGDGTNDGYNLAISFESERIDFSEAGQ